MHYQGKNRLIYFVSGMWCSTCARSVEKSLLTLPEVAQAHVNYTTKLVNIALNTNASLKLSQVQVKIQKEIEKLGFFCTQQSEGWITKLEDQLKSESESKFSLIPLSIVWFLAMWTSMLSFTNYIGDTGGNEKIIAFSVFVIGLPAVLIGTYPYAKSGTKALIFSKLLTIDFIIFLGAISAVTLSTYNLSRGNYETYIDSAAMVIAILLAAKKLEDIIANSVSKNILFQINTKEVDIEVLKKDSWKKASIFTIKRNDLIRPVQDAIIPCDGIIESKGAIVNNHLLTGEDQDVSLQRGDKVFSGAIAKNSFQLSVTAPIGGRMIDQWAESTLLDGASENKFTQLTKKIESKLTLFSLSAATLLATLSFLQHQQIQKSAEAFFIGILVFCPCLFASILPLSRQLASLTLKKIGIDVSGVDSLVNISNINQICIDKTGTLEAVESQLILDSDLSSKSIEMIYQIIEASNHPLLREIENRSVRTKNHEINIKEIPHKGVIASCPDGETIVIGKDELIKHRNSEQIYPHIYLNNIQVGHVLVKKQFHNESIHFLKSLLHIFPHLEINILSGDPVPLAGKELCFDTRIKYFGNLSPEQKAEFMDRNSLFIGDGLNDTLALSKALVSIRVGNRVTSLSSVDFQVPSLKLSKIIDLIYYSFHYKKVLIQTVLCALIYNLIALSLAILGYFSPLGAVCAMIISFTLLLLSSLRLLIIKEDQQKVTLYETNRSYRLLH